MKETANKVNKSSKKRAGRKKGTPNKRTQDIIERLNALNCDPIEGMAKIAGIAMKEGKKQDLALAGQMYKELAQYVAPKRKAIELTGPEGQPIYIPIIKRFDGSMDD